MAEQKSRIDLNYADDLKLIRLMYEDSSYWECILDAKLDYLNFLTNPHTKKCVRNEIATSWVASHDAGLLPDVTTIGETVDDQQYRSMAQSNARLIKVATPMLSNIESLELDNDYVFELLGANGISFAQIGDLELHQFVGEHYLVNEQNTGTNAHSLCMKYKRPFVVIGPEHYCFALHSIIACAAPILDQYRNPLGALLLTQPIPDGDLTSVDKRLFIHAINLLETLAHAISIQVKINSYSSELEEMEYLYNRASIDARRYSDYSTSIIDSTKENILVLSPRHIIEHVSPSVARLLKTTPDDLVGKPVYGAFPHVERQAIDDALSAERPRTITVDGEEFSFSPKRVFSPGSPEKTDGYIISIARKIPPSGSRRHVGDAATVTFDDILGDSPEIHKAKTLAHRFSGSSENVLITGESGTGKELFAQAIHNDCCPDGPFMAINCAAIPERLIESELFGYEPGSFTGADKAGKPGKIELADGGTLFLDEIGDMPISLQATLLRVLETKRVMRIGGTRYKNVNFRLVAATNCDLLEMAHSGTFREDLFYRISVLTVQLPPLRERTGEALFFARYFLSECQASAGGRPVKLSDGAAQFVSSYRWPGNVRQLKHAVYSAYYTCENGVAELTDFPSYLLDDANGKPLKGVNSPYEPSSTVNVQPEGDSPTRASDTLPTLNIAELEKLAIEQALDKAEGNVPEAARLLGLNKTTLYRKLKSSK